MILSYSLDVGHLPLGILFFLILCFHIVILILMLARSIDPNCASFSGKGGAVWKNLL
jgi:preprotein translocase subunit SecG